MIPIQLQAMQIVHMMQQMPGQQLVVDCINEEHAEALYQEVLKIIEAIPK